MRDETAMHLVARALADPLFLETLQSGRAALSVEQQTVAAAIDVRRLALFAGFITMVRHNNDLFSHLPETMRMLRHYGVELSVFRDHFVQKGRPGKNTAEKIQAALASFDDFSHTKPGRRLIGFTDVLLHERSHWEIRSELSSEQQRQAYEISEGSTLISYALTGPARVIRVTREPWAIIAALGAGDEPRLVPRKPQWLLYLGSARTAALRIIGISRLAATLVASIDARTVCSARHGSVRTTRINRSSAVQATLDALVECGAIRTEGVDAL